MKKQNYSKKRIAIYEKICSTTSHPTADWVYMNLKDDYPDLSRGTVYRNLTLFKEQGLIVSVGNVGGQERFDGNVKPHAHFVCTYCHEVIDLHKIDLKSTIDYNVYGSEYDVEITHHNLTLYGLCSKCKNKNNLN